MTEEFPLTKEETTRAIIIMLIAVVGSMTLLTFVFIVVIPWMITHIV
jgi:hypothetical protein